MSCDVTESRHLTIFNMISIPGTPYRLIRCQQTRKPLAYRDSASVTGTNPVLQDIKFIVSCSYLYYYRSSVHKNLSSKFDRFLAAPSQFDTNHGVDLYAPTCCLSATFVRPLLAFVLCSLRQKIINNFAFRHRCDFYAAVFV